MARELSSNDEFSGSITKVEAVLLYLAVCSMLAPPGFQAVITGIMAVWLLWHKGWLPTLRFAHDQNSHNFGFKKILLILIVGLVSSLLFKSINLFLELVNQGEANVLQVMASHVKLAGKQGVWGVFLVLSFQFASSLGWRLDQIVKPLTLTLALLVVYMLAQRYLGINWIYGLEGRIPEHRFSYGVYRASGFIAHPLTMGYNCMIFTILAFGLGRRAGAHSPATPYWYTISALGFFCLLLTNSRVPVLVTIVALAAYIGLSGLSFRKFAASTIILAVIGGYSIKDRLLETYNDPRLLKEKVPRLVFWEVHWDMFRDHPWAGVGYLQKKTATLMYYDKLGYQHLERKYRAHNIYLQTLADTGLVGFLSLLCLLLSLFIVSWISWTQWRIPLLGIIVISTCISGLMQNNLRDSEFLSAFWVSLSICLVVTKERILATRDKIKDFQPTANRSYLSEDV